MMSALLSIVLKLIARKSFNIQLMIIVIALFTSLGVALQVVTYSFTTQSPLLSELSNKPSLYITEEPVKDSFGIKAASVTLSKDSTVLILATDDIERFLHLWTAKYEGDLPKSGEALVGSSVTRNDGGSELNVKENFLEVSGVIRHPSFLRMSVIVDEDTFDRLQLEPIQFYLASRSEGGTLGQAPSATVLIHLITREIGSVLSYFNVLLYLLISISLISLGYLMLLEARRYMLVFTLNQISITKMFFILLTISTVTGLIGISIGYGLGIFLPSIFLSLISTIMDISYLRLLIDQNLLPLLASMFVISTISLMIGLSTGYMRTLARH